MAKIHLNLNNRLDVFISKFNQLSNTVGDVTLLATTGDSDLVQAVNEHEADIGNMVFTGLSATNISAALRELRAELGDHTTLTTDAAVVVPAINEIDGQTDTNTSNIDVLLAKVNPYVDLITVAQSIIPAINEIDSNIGDLSLLSTTAKNSIVSSINEVIDDFRSQISVTDAGGDGSLSYNSSTGVITYTGPSASEVRAHFSAGDGIAISSGQIAINNPTRFRLYDSTGATLLDLYGAGTL